MKTTAELTWGTDILGRARTALARPDMLERPWMILSVSDQLVLYGDGVVARVARPGPYGRERLVTGLRAALELADAGHPVVRPLHDEVFETDIGSVTFWPYQRNTPLNTSTLAPQVAHDLGSVLGRISNHRSGQVEWHPFERLDERLDAGRDIATPEELLTLTNLARQAYDWAVESGAWDTGTFAHGDVSLANVLSADGQLHLIDFDSAGICPAGWDLACLLLRLNLQTYNPAAAAAAARGWAQHAPIPDPVQLGALMAVKLVQATSFMLLNAAADPTNITVFTDRLTVLTGPLERRELPPFIPTRSQYPDQHTL